jgi:hypothetical protein
MMLWQNEVNGELKGGAGTAFVETMSQDSAIYFALLPPRLLGYDLKTKSWAQFDVSGIQEPDWSKAEADWETLVLEREVKRTIKTLVCNHSQKDANWAKGRSPIRDPVDEKGRGFVILLHGLY